MKYVTHFTVSGFLIFTLTSFSLAAQSGQEGKSDAAAVSSIFPAVVARVNGVDIPGRDLDELVRRELNAIGNPEWKNLRTEYKSELILAGVTSLINSSLLFQKAVETGVKVTDAEVQEEFQKLVKSFESEAELDQALAQLNKDRASVMKEISENLTISRFLEKTVHSKITVGAKEVEEYYSSHGEEFRHPEIVRTSHILIRPDGNTPEQDAAARQRAEALLARIKKGEDFAKLARENSSDASASRGGDIGFTSRDGLTPEYSEAAFSLPVGEVTLVKIQNGYHLIKVTDKRQEGQFTLDDVKADLEGVLKNRKYQEEVNRLVSQLRESAKIEILVSAGDLLKS